MNNMSEEEIIEYLKKVIKTIQESDMLFDEPANIRCGIKMEGAIQGLLNLYNEEKEYAMRLYYDVQGLQQDLDKEKEKNKKIEDKIKGKINNLEIFRKTLPIRATEIERFIGELKDLLEE